VFLARNAKSEQLLAAKVVDLRANRKYYDREISALSKIHALSTKKNIIPLVQYGEDEESGYIFTPFLSSGTLYDYIESKKSGVAELEALEILQQIIAGVGVIHDANIVHADLKPENLMYDPKEKTITIFDFGLRLEMNPDKTVRECCGSPLYMAPEVLLRQPTHNGILSDIWSLGILFYYMLFADFPWVDVEDLNDLVDAVLNDVITFPRFVTQEVRSLLLQMLERNPLKRPGIENLLVTVKNLISKMKGTGTGGVGDRCSKQLLRKTSPKTQR